MIAKSMTYDTFSPEGLLRYLEATTEESWCTDVVKDKGGRSCFFGHVFDWGGGDENRNGSRAMDIFEACFATTYMIYPVNDGQHPKYQQKTPKQRCLAYFKDLLSGEEKTTYQLMQEYENDNHH